MLSFRKSISYLLIFTAAMSPAAYANDEQDLENAISESQNVLKNRGDRSELIKKDKAASGADKLALDAAGGDESKQDEIYAIAAELIPFLSKEAGGDPIAMMKILEEAKGNPEKFYRRFPPEQKAKIKKLIESMNTKDSRP
jgi:hypothetical protein